MPRDFRFGVINEQPQARADWRNHVRKIEAWGFDTFLLRDHFAPDYFGDQFAPFSGLMAAAAATERLRIGTMVIGNDYRHPVMLAKDAATLDVLSGGRFELGIGAGWLQREYAQAGMGYDPPATRIKRLDEAIQILKGMFRAAPFSFQGEFYQIDQLQNFPPPTQQPHPPLLIGGGHQRMLQLAGRHADSVGLLTTSVATGTLVDDPRKRMADHVAQQLGWVREGAGARFDQIELSLIITLIVTDERRKRTEELIRARGWAGIGVEEVWQMPAVFIGTPQQIAEQMRHWRSALGFSYFIVGDGDAQQLARVIATGV